MTDPAKAAALAAALLAVELLCAALLYNGWQATPLLLHGAISIAANIIAWRGSALANAPIATLRMAAMLLPFLGPVAPFAATALLLGQLTRSSAQPDAAEWHEHLFPNLAADPIKDRMDAIARRQPASATGDEVESFYDVLRWGTLQEREHILSLISRSFRAEFAPVLREALSSDDLGLRAQAAAGLSLLETRTSARLFQLQQAHHDANTDQTATALAQTLADAAHSGLYDELRSLEMRGEIVCLLAARISSAPALGIILGRTLIHLGELESAVATLTQTVEHDHTDVAFGWLVEGLFRQGDYASLAALIARRRGQAAILVDRDGPLAPALSFWSDAA